METRKAGRTFHKNINPLKPSIMNLKKIMALAGITLCAAQSFAQSSTDSTILSGASATTPNEFIGSYNTYDLDFRTVNVSRMRLTTAGNFGIGTTTPAAKLHVTGNVLFSTALTAPAGGAYIVAKNTVSSAGSPDYTWVTNTNTGVFHPATNVVGISVGGFEKIRVHSNGYIGINTAIPSERLHVVGNALYTFTSVTPSSAPEIVGHDTWSTAATGPDYAWSGDLGTGIFHPVNRAIGFSLNFSEAMRIHSNGYVGINNAAPIDRLHVVGNGLFSSTAAAPTSAPLIAAHSTYTGPGGPDYTWYGNITTGMFHPAVNSIGFSVGGADAIRILSNGFTGLGTITPTAMLSVHNGAVKITGVTPGFGAPEVLFGGSTSIAPNGQWGIECLEGTSTDGLNFWRPSGASGSGGNYVMFLSNTSKVGINTGNPTAQLTVNGNMLVGDPAAVTLPAGYKLYVQTGILTEKVKVALTTSPTDWADYVFEKNYKLRTLDEVKAYIDANSHLPGVPSADELREQGGIDLGKMDAKMMEKIEELTLYIIQINKEKNELADRLAKLEAAK